MSKNTQISELINFISVDGSGNVVFTTVSSATTNTDKFLVSDAGTLKFRTAAQLLSDIGAQASGSYQAALSGTGFVKISGSTISYDNSTYATETYVGTAISNLVASSPATLDTLNELALALGSDPNFATTVATSIGTKQAQLNGTGFVKITGTTISYDNSSYLTTATASSTYLALAGGTLTGALNGTSAKFNSYFGTDMGSGGIYFSGNAAPDIAYIGYNYTNLNGTETTYQSGRSSWRQHFGNGSTNQWKLAYRAPNATASSWTDYLTIASTGLSTFSGDVNINKTGSSTILFLSNGDITTIDGTNAVFLEPQNGGKTSYFGRENSAGSWVFATPVTPYSTVIAAYNTTAPIILGHTNAEITIANGGATTFISNVTATQFNAVNDRNYLSRGSFRLTSSSNNASTLDISVTDSTTSIYSNYYSGGNDNTLVLGTYAYNSNQLVLKSSGRVGIGTATPADKFVISNSGAEGIEFGFDGGFPYLFGYNRSSPAYKSIAFVGNGNVIITQGTIIDNGSKLQVTGAATISGNIKAATGLLSANYTPYTYNDQFEIQNESVWRLRFQAYHYGSGYSYRIVQNNNGADVNVMTFINGNITVAQVATFSSSICLGGTTNNAAALNIGATDTRKVSIETDYNVRNTRLFKAYSVGGVSETWCRIRLENNYAQNYQGVWGKITVAYHPYHASMGRFYQYNFFQSPQSTNYSHMKITTIYEEAFGWNYYSFTSDVQFYNFENYLYIKVIGEYGGVNQIRSVTADLTGGNVAMDTVQLEVNVAAPARLALIPKNGAAVVSA